MKKILMILTSHRLDCFKLCMDLLLNGGSIRRFDRVVLLLNGVRGRHARYVRQIQMLHPDIPWDCVSGPRGRGFCISNLQNECVRRYPDSLYFKIDEDTFVSSDWDLILQEAHASHRSDPDLSLVTATIPNNALGCWHLLNLFPDIRDEYLRLPHAVHGPAADGPVWFYPHLAEWMIRRFLDIENANRLLRAVAAEPCASFFDRFSINCICYDYRHWREIGGVQEHDEVGWGAWIKENRKRVVVASRTLVHHYTFFNQQDWLDRSSLLEDIRIANLPSTLWTRSFAGRFLPRAGRVARQIPAAVKRRLNRPKA